MSNYNIKRNNLYQEFIEAIKYQLSVLGRSLSDPNNDMKIAYDFFDYQYRTVETKPRSVLKSKEFIQHYDSQTTDIREGVDFLIQKIENGENITPHFSKGILKTDLVNNRDPLLYDWGIHHLHLGTTPCNDDSRFISRTGPLLFTKFVDNTAYFIGIMEHGVWNKLEHLEVIESYWPEVLADEKLPADAQLISSVPTTEEVVKKYRKGRVTTGVILNSGNYYFPMGGGFTTSGHSNRVQGQALRLINHFKALESDINLNPSKKLQVTFKNIPLVFELKDFKVHGRVFSYKIREKTHGITWSF